MGDWVYVVAMVLAGTLIALQAPINASLARTVGFFESALMSFTVGALALLPVVLVWGKGDLRQLASARPWQLAGGLLGAGFVTLIILAVGRVGLTTVLVASLVGQLAMGLMIDHFGWFEVGRRPLEWQRAAGVALLAIALWLIYGRR